MLARTALLAAGLAGGCVTLPAPYQFESRLLSGVTAIAEPIARPPRRPAPPPAPGIHRDDLVLADRAMARVATAMARAAAAAPGFDPLPREELPPAIDPATLPARHLEPERAVPRVASPGDLRALVGARTRHPPHAFAVAAATSLTARAGPGEVPADGEALAAWARAHADELAPGDAGVGDLLVFDRTAGDAPASLWAVVVGRDRRGVIEMLYVATGVVRRGFVDPARPRIGRGPDRAVHNTFLRHGTHWPPRGSRFLSGELLAGAFRLR